MGSRRTWQSCNVSSKVLDSFSCITRLLGPTNLPANKWSKPLSLTKGLALAPSSRNNISHMDAPFHHADFAVIKCHSPTQAYVAPHVKFFRSITTSWIA